MARTVRVEESVRIARPPAAVWNTIADYGFDREWRNGLLDMTSDPPGATPIGPFEGGRSVRADGDGGGAVFTYRGGVS